ncbi:MAG TPA: SelB C-terminal domain-containing protein, partial [Acidobacteriota bacterium]|nr:SelB C-terminal domain-containing protein [Acidobacteriota bacterium]
SATFDVMLRLLPGDSQKALKHRAPVRFHHGSAEIIGRVYLLGQAELAPGQESPAQLRLDCPTIACPFDHFIIRSYSPVRTIGGGLILDNAPPKHSRRDLPSALSTLSALSAARALPADRTDRTDNTDGAKALLLYLIRRKKKIGASLAELIARTGLLPDAIMPLLKDLAAEIEVIPHDPPLAVERQAFEQLKSEILDFVRAARIANPLSPGVLREELRTRFLPNSPPAYLQFLLDRLQDDKQVTVSGGHVLEYGVQVGLSDEQEKVRQAILAEVGKAGFQPPAFEDLAARLPYPRADIRAIYHYLLQNRELIRISSDIVVLSEQVQLLKDQIRQAFQPGHPFTVADFKDLLNISRKYAIPYLEYLDRERITRRAGDKRILL